MNWNACNKKYFYNSMNMLQKNNFFFIGVGGAGMSAIAQYLSGSGKQVSGSDRLFASAENDYIKQQLSDENITCYIQDGSGITAQTEIVVCSTAIEETNIEIKKARELQIPIVFRSDLLAAICSSKRTVAIAGTSGKSTTTAMLYHILEQNGVSPSIISGAGLTALIKQGKIGNAVVGKSDWLLIEADESDGSLVKYKPEIGLLLSIDKDHKELSELHDIFQTFKNNTQQTFIVNQSHLLAKEFSQDVANDFGHGTMLEGTDFIQEGFSIRFQIKNTDTIVTIPTLGMHNMENTLACIAVAKKIGLTELQCANALKTYEGIYRRHQLLGEKKGIKLIDDYAHNPAKIAASIKACLPVAPKLIAWFQPHGYGPTRFIRKELVEEITKALRPQDELWMSEIYYAGGTAVKDISANDLIKDLQAKGVHAFFTENRNDLVQQMQTHFTNDCTLLLMGARDPSLEKFGKEILEKL